MDILHASVATVRAGEVIVVTWVPSEPVKGLLRLLLQGLRSLRPPRIVRVLVASSWTAHATVGLQHVRLLVVGKVVVMMVTLGTLVLGVELVMSAKWVQSKVREPTANLGNDTAALRTPPLRRPVFVCVAIRCGRIASTRRMAWACVATESARWTT